MEQHSVIGKEPTIQEVMEFIQLNQDYLKTAEKLYNIYNRQITPYIKQRLVSDLKGQNSREEAMSRISAINILPMVVDKLSQAYRSPVDRKATQGINEKQLGDIVTTWDLENTMEMANKMLNLFRCVAIEPVFTESRFRVLPAHRFLAMSDGTIDNVMVAFIKVIGDEIKATANQGQLLVTEYEVITASETYTLDSSGGIKDRVPHEFGMIPIVYATRDIVTLQPPEDMDTFEMVTLLPILLTDGNFAIKFQCFSIIYTMNLEAKNMTLSPNAVWNFKSTGQEGDKGELGMLKPTVAVEDILSFIKAQFALWLESKKLKMQSFASAQLDSVSGIAKAIDQADVTADLAYQRKIFSDMERRLFALLGKEQNAEYKVATSFHPEALMPETNKEKTEVIALKLENNLLSWEQALKEANNHMTTDALQAMMEQIKVEKKEREKENENGELRSGDQLGRESQEALA
jgi:hypothetical protein